MAKIKLLIPITLILFSGISNVFAQSEAISEPPKFALVIGNGAYANLSRLTNPVNDANDITHVLQQLGFSVDIILNGSLNEMEDAIMRLRDRLSVSDDAFGFFFYAGHGIQSGGENFLIPVDANIPSESFLRARSISVQTILSELNDAGNGLNVVVFDACRDNPFGWSRSGSRGLTLVTRQPADSIIVFATSAGDVADDGQGRNGLFTEHFLNNLINPDLEVQEVLRRTGADVSRASSNQQIPAIYSQFFGTAFFGPTPDSSGIVPQPIIRLPVHEPQWRETIGKTQLWSIGASVGSSFNAPWLIGTLKGTVAPFKHSFFEIGLDMGTISGIEDVGYFSIHPFINIAYYYPINFVGLYAGAGGGYKYANLDFQEGKVSRSVFAFNVLAGIGLFDFLDISYTLRASIDGAMSSKMAIGYTYRFFR